MTVALVCDSCESTATGRGGQTLERWWSLTRHGEETAERGPLGLLPPIELHSDTVIFTGDAEPDDSKEEPDQDEDLEPFDDVVLHFCSADCLAKWAAWASATEAT